MPIEWRQQMSIGNVLIDGDHRYLIALINNVELALRGDGANDALVHVLEQLRLYTEEHFEREEKLMRAVAYPGLEEHRQVHGELVVRLVEIRRNIEDAAPRSLSQTERDPLIELLRSWILDHVLKQDMLMKPLVSQFPENFCG